MNDDLRKRIITLFESVDGGSCTDMYSMIDVAIDDGDITQEEWDNNEMEICTLFDNGWFTCEGCGWTMPISDQDERGEWHCKQCMDEEHGDCED